MYIKRKVQQPSPIIFFQKLSGNVANLSYWDMLLNITELQNARPLLYCPPQCQGYKLGPALLQWINETLSSNPTRDLLGTEDGWMDPVFSSIFNICSRNLLRIEDGWMDPVFSSIFNICSRNLLGIEDGWMDPVFSSIYNILMGWWLTSFVGHDDDCCAGSRSLRIQGLDGDQVLREGQQADQRVLSAQGQDGHLWAPYCSRSEHSIKDLWKLLHGLLENL